MSSLAEPVAGQPEARGGNLASLASIQVFRMGSGVAVNLVLMRSLGVEGFGVYGYVTTLVGLASFGSSLGMDRLIKREIARDEASAGRYVATALAASTLLSLVTGVAIGGWVWLADGRAEVVVAAALATLAVGLHSLATMPISYFHAIRRMGLSVHGNLAGRAVLVLATVLLLWLELGVLAVFVAQVLDAAVMLLFVGLRYRRMSAPPLTTGWTEVRGLIGAAVPFGLNSLFVQIYLGVDVLLLAWIRGDAEVGVYRGAVMLLALFPIVADTLSTGLYPRMARHVGRADLAGSEVRFAARILLAISVPAAVGGVLTAGPLMVFLGGPAFASSALPFAVLAPLLPLRFLNNSYGMTLSALDRQGHGTRGAFYAAALNVCVNLFVIPRWGAVGAAATTVFTEAMLLVWMYAQVAPLVNGMRLRHTLMRVAIPAAAMAAGLLLLPPVHVLVQIGLGATLYVACGLSTGAFHPRDLGRLRSV
ncbi:MAG: flippase [Pseudomonadota bacterium]|nr:flippase [Pseudomonadota bacterium]